MIASTKKNSNMIEKRKGLKIYRKSAREGQTTGGFAPSLREPPPSKMSGRDKDTPPTSKEYRISKPLWRVKGLRSKDFFRVKRLKNFFPCLSLVCSLFHVIAPSGISLKKKLNNIINNTIDNVVDNVIICKRRRGD